MSDNEDIRDEAREDYDLLDRLRGISRRGRKVTVYTDEPAMEELGGAEDEKNGYGVTLGRRRWGVLGELDALRSQVNDLRETARLNDQPVDEGMISELAAKADGLKKRVTALQKKLQKTQMTFTLRGVPDVVITDCRRLARQHLGIKKKRIPEDLADEYNARFAAEVLSQVVVKFEDAKDGVTRTSISPNNAALLPSYLPVGEYPKIDRKVYEIQFEKALGEVATDDADF